MARRGRLHAHGHRLDALASQETDAEKIAQFARGKLKAKTAQHEQALTGRLTPTQRFLLKELSQQYDYLQGSIGGTRARIAPHSP